MVRASGTRPENTASGVLLIVASVFLLSLSDALVKLASADIPLWQLYVTRSLIAVPILFALLLRGGRPAAIRPKSPGWVLLRSMLLVLMWIAYYAALPLMSLPVAATALYTTPLFIALFAVRLIGEPVGLRRWLGIAVGFVGVLVALRPGADALSGSMLLPIVAAVFYALAAVITRDKCAEERPLVLALGLNLSLLGVGVIATGALAVWGPDAAGASAYPFLFGRWTAMQAREWGVVALLAVLMVAVSTGVAKAYQSGPTAVIGIFDYAYLVFAVLWSFAIFSEAPDGAMITGMILIAAAGSFAVGKSAGVRRVRRTPWQGTPGQARQRQGGMPGGPALPP